MGTTLQHGIFLPAEGERNCYAGLASNWTILDGMIGGYSSHAANLTIHVTAEDKEAWNGKADSSALTAHTGNTTIHVTAEDKEAWNGKADASALTAHTGDTTIHVTAEDKAKWDAVTSKADDSDVVHKSGDETISGNKTFSSINGVEPGSLSLPSDRNARIDISSYFTNTGNGDNEYVASANGYIFLDLGNVGSVFCTSLASNRQVNYRTANHRNSYGANQILFPITKGNTAKFSWSTSSTVTISGAFFIPCIGNV